MSQEESPPETPRSRRRLKMNRVEALLESHISKCEKELQENPDSKLDANDRQCLALYVKTTEIVADLEEDESREGMIFAYDKRFEELGQAVAIGDVPGATRRLYALKDDCPKGLRVYWWDLFGKTQPSIMDRLGKWDWSVEENGMPPIKGGSITPMPDNDVEIPEDLENFKPDEYGVGSMPIPGIPHAICQITGRAFWEHYKSIRERSGQPKCAEEDEDAPNST